MLGSPLLNLRGGLRAFLVLSAAILTACGTGDFDRSRLEREEDRNESLANDLLAFSVAARDRDFESVSQYVSTRIQATPLPAEPPPSQPLVKWMHHRDWPIDTRLEWMDREGFTDNLKALDRTLRGHRRRPLQSQAGAVR